MRVILFQRRFWDKVLVGEKRQTIRRSARCAPGDTLSLRGWSGLPYRSRQVVLGGAVCERVLPVEIHLGLRPEGMLVRLDGVEIDFQAAWELAVADGFEAYSDMLRWFHKFGGLRHGMPFVGEAIRWGGVAHGV